MKILRETLIYPIFDVESDFEVYLDCKSCLKELGCAASNPALYLGKSKWAQFGRASEGPGPPSKRKYRRRGRRDEAGRSGTKREEAGFLRDAARAA